MEVQHLNGMLGIKVKTAKEETGEKGPRVLRPSFIV